MHNLAALGITSITIIRGACLKSKNKTTTTNFFSLFCNGRRWVHCGGITPSMALWKLTQSRKPGKDRAEPSFRGWRAGSPPRGAPLLRSSRWLRSRGCTRVRTSPAPTNLGAAQKPGFERERAWCSGSCFVISRDPRENISRAKKCPPVITLRPKSSRSFHFQRNCGSRLTAPNLTASTPNLTPAPSHRSHSVSRAHPTRAAPTRTPRPPPSHPLGSSRGNSPTRPGSRCGDEPASPRLPSLGSGSDFLGEPASSRCALLTCVFFIRKGSAVIQPRQRCGDSV